MSFMSMALYIDTTDFNKVTFGISDGEKIVRRSYKIDPHKSHETLGFLDKFLKSAKIKPSPPKPLAPLGFRAGRPSPRGRGGQIAKIVVNKGPGSYTGVRVGVAHALALGFVWGVPVKAVSNDKFKII
jgi:tRNA A37 threonylcarbamoyladenosine modification protein TsaB